MIGIHGKDWRELSEAASKKRDSDKLIMLVSELNRVRDQREQENARRQREN